MESDQKNTPTDRRLAALEHSVAELHAQLDDVRIIITSALDVVLAADDQCCDEIDAIRDKIEQRLDPVFHQVFPRHREFLEEVDAILRNGR